MRLFANHRAALGGLRPRRDGTTAVTDQAPDNPGIAPPPPIELAARVPGWHPNGCFRFMGWRPGRIGRRGFAPDRRDPKRSSLSGLRPFRASPA
jgi:hypothetical protein